MNRMLNRKRGTALVSPVHQIPPGATPAQRLRIVAARHAEEAMAEVPGIMRRLKTFLLVLCVSVPVFGAGLLFVLWRLVH